MRGETADEARERLSADLGIDKDQLRFVREKNKEFSFEASVCPPILDIEVSKDKLKARIRRIQLPQGDSAPKLTTDFVLEQLKKKGIQFGIKTEEITAALFKISSDPNFNDTKPLSILVAEGESPSSAQGGRPQWVLDLKKFEGGKFALANKDEVVAKAPTAVPGREGKTVTGEPIPFDFEESFRLPIGKGIGVRRVKGHTEYFTESFGRVFVDDGTRVRLDVDIKDQKDGLEAVVELVGPKTFSGKSVSAQDILEAASAHGVSKGLLSLEEVERQIRAVKKWPARIVLAKGKDPVDGQLGDLKVHYKTPHSEKPLDVERAKLGIVFPGEIIASIQFAHPPQDGFTVFGEVLRGRQCNEQPIYPGKNVKRVRLETHEELHATAYGQVKIVEDRIHVENIVRVSQDAMEATLDLFPQQPLRVEDIQNLLRDKDVLAGYEKEDIEKKLQLVANGQRREPKLVLAKARPVIPGKSAKIRYYFRPSEMKSKGILIKSQPRDYFAAPGDLLLVKFLPEEAVEGFNLYREKIPVPAEMKSADIQIKVGDLIREELRGKDGDPNDLPRIEFRAESFGVVSWKNKELSLKSVIEIPESEDFVQLRLPQKSDFGRAISFELVKKVAEEEGVRVELDREAIERCLRTARAKPTDLVPVEIARSQPAKNGENAKIEYFVKINGESVEKFVSRELPTPEEILQADCVRPGDVIAIKTPAGTGEDGKSVFGRRIVAERGVDEPWMLGRGLERSSDDRSLVVQTQAPAFVFVEDGRLVARSTLEIAPDKMSASMTIYPSSNPRFQAREERVMTMIQAEGIQAGLQIERIREAIQSCLTDQAPQTFEVAVGQAPEVGTETSYELAVDTDRSQLRSDGSVDHKAASVFLQVRKGQLLLLKRPATRGADGFNILDQKIPGIMGKDYEVAAGEGVKVSDSGLEYYSTRDGILEFTGKRIQVIEGLMVNGDVDYSTGNIDSDQARVIIRGSVLPGFELRSKSDVKVEKVAEACIIEAGGELSVSGGIVGKDKAHISAKKKLECLYINSGATVECHGDIVSRNEILNSQIRSGGRVLCVEGAGAVSGGEIWSQKGVEAKVFGAQGSESKTHIHLGLNFMELQAALKRIEDEGLKAKEEDLRSEMAEMDKELKEIYEKIPEASEKSPEDAAELQAQYKDLYENRKLKEEKLGTVERQKAVILKHVQKAKDFKVIAREMIHPGVVFHHEGVEWVIREPMRAVEISWSEASKNFVMRKAP